MESFELENKSGKYTLDDEKFIELQAATLLSEENFTDLDETPDDFIKRVDLSIPTPRKFDRTLESTTLGNAIFVAIGKYGIDFIDKMLSNETAKYQIHCLFDYAMQLIDILNASTNDKSDK